MLEDVSNFDEDNVCSNITSKDSDVVYDIASRYGRLESTVDPIHFMFEDVRPDWDRCIPSSDLRYLVILQFHEGRDNDPISEWVSLNLNEPS